MAKIITAFRDRQTARQIAAALEASGLSVFRVCATGNEVMRAFNQCSDGILVCGTAFADRTVDSLCEDLGERALVTKPLEQAILEKRPDLVMACGPAPMLAAVQALCEKYALPCQISLEERMGCGIGACLGCNVKIKTADGGWCYKRVCKDGPVFDAKEVCLNG